MQKKVGILVYQDESIPSRYFERVLYNRSIIYHSLLVMYHVFFHTIQYPAKKTLHIFSSVPCGGHVKWTFENGYGNGILNTLAPGNGPD